jgi:hypothetical protein
VFCVALRVTVMASDDRTDRRKRLREALERAARYLPVQAPLEVFVHNNLLTAFQHLPFHQGLAEAQRKLGIRGYLPEERYRAEFARGRITEADLDAVLADEDYPRTPVAPGFPAGNTVARLVTLHGICAETPADLHWQVVEKEATTYFFADVPNEVRKAIVAATEDWLTPKLASAGEAVSDELARLLVGEPELRSPQDELAALLGARPRRDAFPARREAVAVRALWTACVDACKHYEGQPQATVRRPRFHRDLLLATSDEDTAELTASALVPLCAAFLDRGQSHWSMPDREKGFFAAWLRVKLAGRSIRPGWLHALGERMQAWQSADVGAEDAALELLEELGVEVEEYDDFIEHTLLQLPGWAGMFHKLEQAPGPIGRSRGKIDLIDYLAVRLALDRFAFVDVAARLGHAGPPAAIRRFCAGLPTIAPPELRGPHDTAWPLFLLAQFAGVAAPAIRDAKRSTIDAIVGFLDRLGDTARTRLWHEAYEHHYRVELLDALAAHARVPQPPQPPPRWQVLLCLDDRFESSRRHLEEIAPECETYGGPGFFGIPFAYQGIDDPSTFPLCPVIVTPQHRIDEEPLTMQVNVAELRKQRLQRWGHLQTLFSRASRSLWLGLLVSIAAGVFSMVPLLLSVFAPRTAGRLRARLRKRFLPAPKTRLTPARIGADKLAPETLYLGFTVDEMAGRIAALLENLGLTRRFGRLIVALGHDTSSANNPLLAAYSCAACGGRSGGPNARLLMHAGNRPDVRQRLAARGITLPPDTWFVGGVYDTCEESISWIDLDELPKSARDEVERLQPVLDEMCRRNAHERARRFASAPRRMTPAQARRHAEERAVDLSQPRAELGHATCANSIVGRRELSQHLFLDRRSLLISYDPTIDPQHKILERTLAATAPVGAGISLDYYCSSVDPERLGSGTKLPHNVTALLGVMNGAQSDLRTGLPTQATEAHEPVRLHVVIETTPDALPPILERQPAVAELVKNEWVRVATIDPNTRQIHTFDARFGFRPYRPRPIQLPVVPRSRDWYLGQSDCLRPARIVPPTQEALRAAG